MKQTNEKVYAQTLNGQGLRSNEVVKQKLSSFGLAIEKAGWFK